MGWLYFEQEPHGLLPTPSFFGAYFITHLQLRVESDEEFVSASDMSDVDTELLLDDAALETDGHVRPAQTTPTGGNIIIANSIV